MIVNYIAVAVLIVIGALAYRLRGGGWFTLNSDFVCRFAWGTFGLSLPFMILIMLKDAPADGADFYYSLSLLPLAFVAMFVPHAAYQNMGRWRSPQKTWPAFFLPTLTQIQWTSMPMAARTLHDFLGMMGVGFFRGLFVFGSYTAMWGLFPHDILPVCWKSILFFTAAQPLAYLIGKFTPFTITASLPAYSSEWGEFFSGAAWVMALVLV